MSAGVPSETAGRAPTSGDYAGFALVGALPHHADIDFPPVRGLGTDEDRLPGIKREWFLDTVRAFTLIGAFFIMSFYFIAFYLLRKTDRAPLLFALFCIVMALRTLAMDQRFVVHLFDGFSWRVTRSLEYGGIYLGVPVFAAFLKALYGRFISTGS